VRIGISRVELYGESAKFGLAYNSAPERGFGRGPRAAAQRLRVRP